MLQLTQTAVPNAFDLPRPPVSKALSAVVPCYNEQEGLQELVLRLSAACRAAAGMNFEIVLVNDGSSDRTWEEIVRLSGEIPQIIGIDLARNHGHQLALTAGLFLSRGERIFIIDADLQDPPELLAQMMAALDAGADVAFGQRIHRDGETWFKKASAKAFYRVLRRLTDAPIPADTGDFRLMTRQVLDVLMNMPEQHRFVRGMVAWIGFRQVAVPYRRDPRHAGTSKYPLRKMITFAMDAITGFSIAPLRLSLYLSAFSILLAALVGAFTLWSYLTMETAPGWTSIAIIVLTFGAIQMLCLAIMGEYLGRTYMQTKQRPLFVIRTIHGGDAVSPTDRS
ncbi:MAG TPA: glycosyltransferase family 2 protein [Rhizomicrobium sp.]|nr:glycosyltransferase family 2 protein [Rhizomicrobium sp.]